MLADFASVGKKKLTLPHSSFECREAQENSPRTRF
jgi:hypothetical protein